jgi:hypothetical protein
MFTDAHAAFFSPRSSPGVAWVVVLLVAPVLATGWLWLAWDSAFAWLCWICVGAVLRYWHGGHIRWTRLARLLFAAILLAPLVLFLWSATIGGLDDPLAFGVPLTVFLLWFLATWDAPDALFSEAPAAGFLLAAVLSLYWGGTSSLFAPCYLAASFSCLWTTLAGSSESSASTPIYPYSGSRILAPTAGLLLAALLATSPLGLLLAELLSGSRDIGIFWSIGVFLIVVASACFLPQYVMSSQRLPNERNHDGALTKLFDFLCFFLVALSVALVFPLYAAVGAGLMIVVAPAARKRVMESSPVTSAGLVYFALLVLAILTGGRVLISVVPSGAELNAAGACVFALGLWLLPGVLGAAEARRMTRTGACSRDYHRLTPAPNLHWLVRLTGHRLYEVAPRQPDDLADSFVCRKCGGRDIITARRLLGVIGALPGTPDSDEQRHVLLYAPESARGISADIDQLDLYPPQSGTALDWDHAINAVVNALTEDHDRTHPLERIPVRIHAGLMLPENARRVLAAHFGPVSVPADGPRTRAVATP